MVLNISLFTKLHLPIVGHKIPYFVPNGAAAVVISQIFGSIIFEIYILLSYRAFRSPDFAKNAYQYFWLTISYSPGTRHTFNPSHHHHLLTLFFFFFFHLVNPFRLLWILVLWLWGPVHLVSYPTLHRDRFSSERDEIL